MREESDLRQLAKSLKSSASKLEGLAQAQPALVKHYNSLCDVLDGLNQTLSLEREGPIEANWKKLPDT